MADAIEQRRLAAIMFTDMVGYSALTQCNEALALALVAEQQRLLRPILARHGGREVKGTGDGYLVEFASALQAVSCAIDMQKAMSSTIRRQRRNVASRYASACTWATWWFVMATCSATA